MNRISRIAMSLAIAGSLFACSRSEPEAPAESQTAVAEEEVTSSAEDQAHSTTALLDACNIELLEPRSLEWDTKWDPAYSRDASQHPSGVRSAHWMTGERLEALQQANAAVPFELSCGSDAGAEYSILIEMVARGSSLTDFPMQAGSHPIVAGSGPVAPGQMVVGNLQFEGSSFEARGGSLTLERFDSEGAAGNFVIEGREMGGENRPLRIEGSFDMPCRRGAAQSSCSSDKAEME